jgi:hypothetical protein
MLSEKEAIELATRYIERQCRGVRGGVAIMEDRTIRKSYGWIFFYNSNVYLETRNPLEALGGNGPIVVMQADGHIHPLGSALAPAASIAEFELVHGLK